jgi:hypothetical protein
MHSQLFMSLIALAGLSATVAADAVRATRRPTKLN